MKRLYSKLKFQVPHMITEEKIQVLNSWNSYFKYDPTDSGSLERKFFGNPFIKPVSTLTNGKAYSLMGLRSTRFLYAPFEKNIAWILSAAPGDEDELSNLLERQIEECKKLGIKRVYYSNFSPGYFFPGIDREKYAEVFGSLIQAGFKEDSVALAMEAEIGEHWYEEKKDDSVVIKCLGETEKQEFLEFIEKNFPADCFYRANGVLSEGSLQQVIVAKVNGKFAGYAMYSAGEGPMEFAPGERFGCFEVSETHRSMGIGTKLLVRTLNSMKANGIRHTYFLWTSEKASHLYLRYGFKITRQFSIMVLKL
jgi:N-acetylglutamate synthase-like GNAT family acetyltransferase